jgi:hypothetical protein
LLEAYADLNLRRAAEEAVAVDHVVVRGGDFYGDDVAGEFGGEGKFADGALGAVFGHEDGAAAGYALEDAEEASAAGELGVRGHLDGAAHPGKFSGFGDDGLVGLEQKLENWHCGAGDAALHECAPIFKDDTAGSAWQFLDDRSSIHSRGLSTGNALSSVL